MNKIATIGSLLIFSLASPLLAASGPSSPLLSPAISEDPVKVRSFLSLTSVPRGGTVAIAIELDTEIGWHVNAHEVTDDYLIPTKVEVETPPGITVEKTIYPEGIEKKLDFSDSPLLLYQGRTLVGLELRIDSSFPLGDTTLTAKVTYQACDNSRCLPPEERALEIAFRVSTTEEAIDAINHEVFAKIDFGKPNGESREGSEAGRLERLKETRGMGFLFLMVFIGGLALNLTPCVYPIIPITVSYFGAQSRGKTSRTLVLALLYVMGMAVMYSSLGLMAALTGSILGSALQNPFVLSIVALVLVLLALSMFGFYELRIPARLGNVAGTSKQGMAGALLMGLTVGIVAAPCIGPFVLGLLTFVGESADPLLGFLLFFALAVGLGLPFIALALLSGSISSLPRSGEWMEWVRKLFGVILLGMAVYFLEPVTGSVAYYVLLGALLVGSGLLLGVAGKVATSALFFLVLRRFVGIVLPLMGLYFVLAPGHIIGSPPDASIPWHPYDPTLLEDAKNSGKPVVIDFYADWCLPCKELDHRTFNQAEARDAVLGTIPLKADLTRSSSPEVKKLREKYSIRGVPTIVFIDGKGRERKDLRAFGFIDKHEFARRLRTLKGEATSG